LTLILCDSGIVNNNIANQGSQQFDYGLHLLHSPWSMQDTRPKLVDTPLTLILGGSNIVTNNISNTRSQFFDYRLMLLQSPWIMQDARP